jgi:hypothetical protein
MHGRAGWFLASAIAIAALALPAAAGAGDWRWPASGGWGYLEEYGDRGPSCVFHLPGGEQCSGWNYWAYVQAETFDDDGATIACGFQNYGVARERRVTTYDRYCFATPGELGMPSYVEAYGRWYANGDDDTGIFGRDVGAWLNSTT